MNEVLKSQQFQLLYHMFYRLDSKNVSYETFCQ